MDEYIENSELPSAIEQKYEWSCQICNIKEALNHLLKTNITEDDLLSRIEHISAGKTYFNDIQRVIADIKKVTKKDVLHDTHLYYLGLDSALESFCNGKIGFALELCLANLPKVGEKVKKAEKPEGPTTIYAPSDFERAVQQENQNGITYQIVKELIQNNVIISASGERIAVNKINEPVSHAFLVKGIGEENGKKFLKVLDSNYKRRNLLPEYSVPLQKFSVYDIFFKL